MTIKVGTCSVSPATKAAGRGRDHADDDGRKNKRSRNPPFRQVRAYALKFGFATIQAETKAAVLGGLFLRLNCLRFAVAVVQIT